MERATKPINLKYIYSRFSITRFMKEYDYPEFLIIGEYNYISIKAICKRNAKKRFRIFYPHQKILTVKKINKQK